MVLRPARFLRPDLLAQRAAQQSGFAVTQSVYYTVLISGRDTRLPLRGLAGGSWGRKPSCVLMLLGGGAIGRLRPDRGVRRQPGAADRLRPGHAVLPVRHVGGALHLYAGALSDLRARHRLGLRLGGRADRLAARPAGHRAGPAAHRPGAVFTLGALCFGVAALVVWAFGIETRGRPWRSLPAEPARRRKTL